MRTAHKLLVLFTSGILIGASSNVQAETIQDAVKYMLQAYPEIRSQSYNRMARDFEVRQAKAGYLPTIDLTAGTGVNRQNQPVFDTTWPYFATLSVRQNVFRFFGTQSEVERQQARAKSQAYLVQSTAENIALEATRTYLNVLKNKELYDLTMENLTNHRRILDQVKLRSESGVDRKADLDQVMGRMALAEANVVAAQANMVDANTDYQAVIGHMPGDLTKPDPAGSAIPTTIEDAEQLAIKNNPTIKSSKADLEARNAQYEAAKSQLYPSLDVSLDYRWQKDLSFVGRQEEFLALATISFNIFNGGFNKARLGQTRAEMFEAQEISDNTRRQTIQSVRLSWEAFKAASDRVTHLEDYVKAAGLTADAFTTQWNIGRRTMFDLLDTQAEYINAKASLVNAKFDKQFAEYRVLSIMSNLISHLGLQQPPQGRVALADK